MYLQCSQAKTLYNNLYLPMFKLIAVYPDQGICHKSTDDIKTPLAVICQKIIEYQIISLSPWGIYKLAALLFLVIQSYQGA